MLVDGTFWMAYRVRWPLTVLYDGLLGGDMPIVTSPDSDGALRYVSAVPLPGGRTRFYFEAARPDGAHDLMTSIS